MLVDNRFIIYLFYTTSLFLFCLFGRRPRGSDVHVHVYYCKGHYIFKITRDNQIASVFQSSQCVIKLYFCNKQQMKNQQHIPKLKTYNQYSIVIFYGKNSIKGAVFLHVSLKKYLSNTGISKCNLPFLWSRIRQRGLQNTCTSDLSLTSCT